MECNIGEVAIFEQVVVIFLDLLKLLFQAHDGAIIGELQVVCFEQSSHSLQILCLGASQCAFERMVELELGNLGRGVFLRLLELGLVVIRGSLDPVHVQLLETFDGLTGFGKLAFQGVSFCFGGFGCGLVLLDIRSMQFHDLVDLLVVNQPELGKVFTFHGSTCPFGVLASTLFTWSHHLVPGLFTFAG